MQIRLNQQSDCGELFMIYLSRHLLMQTGSVIGMLFTPKGNSARYQEYFGFVFLLMQDLSMIININSFQMNSESFIEYKL